MTQFESDENGLAMIELPEKTYFKIGEVAKLLEVEPYVLRYWETEFEVLAPEKTKSGQRVYQRDDIELLFQIRCLLYEEMFTIAGARRQLERSREGKPSYFDLDGEPVRGQGTAVADESELRQELESARKELARSQTKLGDLESKFEGASEEASRLKQDNDQLRDENDELRVECATLCEQLEEQGAPTDHQLVAELQREITDLKQQLKRVERQADERRLALQRQAKTRKKHRRDVLGSLRREVETLAALVEAGPVSRG